MLDENALQTGVSTGNSDRRQ